MFQTMIRKGFAFFLALLLALSYSLTAINPITVSANTISENEPNSFKTTLVDRTTKSDLLTFDIWAKDADGNKISKDKISVTNNSKSVAVNWDDSVKTSYTLNLSTGENKVNITVNGDVKISKDYTIVNVDAEDGENIGDYIFSLDAFTVGLGYIIEPTRMPIYKGQNAAQILDNQLSNQGFSYDSTGSLESGFYLSTISKNEGSIYEAGVNIPQEIEDLDYGVKPDDHGDSLGEFDFNYMSGWMYKLNNVFPNVGFSDSYLQENDVMSVQFTIGYGAELGDGWSDDLFPAVNRDEITKQLAYINSAGKWKSVFLANSKVQETYDKQMELMAKFGVEQEEIDSLEQEMNVAIGEVINPLIASLPESISSDDWKGITETVEALENTTESQQETFENIEKYNSLKEKYEQFELAEQLATSFAKLPEVSEVTLANDLKNTLKLQDIYLGLEVEYQNLIENRQRFIDVLNQINVLLGTTITDIEAKIDALPTVGNLALSDEELISAIDKLIAELDNASQLKVTNIEKLTVVKEQLVVLKNNKKVADVMAMIDALPAKEDVVLADKIKIKEVRAVYTALSTTLRKDVTNFTKLTDAEAKISWYEATNTVFNSIENLPTLEALNFGNEARVKSVRASYNKLDDIQKAGITNVSKLEAVEAKLIEYAPIKAVETLLTALPTAYSTKLTDQEKITKARAEYDKLSADYKKVVQSSLYNRLVASETKLQTLIDTAAVAALTKLINELPTVENTTLADLEAVKSMRTQYELLTAENKARVSNYEAFEAVEEKVLALEMAPVKEIEELISKLPTVENATLEDLEAVTLIRKQYDSLTETNKAKVSNYEVFELIEEKVFALEIAPVKEIEELISKLPTVENATLEDLEAVKLIRKQYDLLSETTKKKVSNYKAFEAVEEKVFSLEMAPVKEIEELISKLPTVENTTLADLEAVKSMRTQYELLTAENKARVSNYGAFELIEEKVLALEMAPVKEIEELISKLASVENATLEDLEAVTLIRTQYELLTETNKGKVTNYTMFQQVETKILALENAQIQEVEQLISKLPVAEKVELYHEKAINEAVAAFEKLTESQVGKMKEVSQKKLQLTKQAFIEKRSQTQINEVISLINTLPQVENLMLEDEKKLVNTNNQLEELTNEQLQSVTNKAVLDVLLASMSNLKMYDFNAKINEVNNMISVLPDFENIDITDESKLEQITKKFDRLSEKQKQKIVGYSQIAKMQTKIADLTQGSLVVFEAIAKLPKVENLTGKNRPAIEEVRNTFTQLTAGQQALVKNKAQLEKVERALAQEESNAILKVVVGIITLPELDKATLESYLEITEWFNKYNDLTADQKKLITNASKLEALVEKMEMLHQSNNLIAQKVIKQISLLTSVITVDDKESVEKARAAYEKLTIEQQSIIYNYDVLVKNEKILAPLVEKDLKAATKVETYINALPTVSNLVVTDESAVKVVRKAYDFLTTTQKALVKNLMVLENAEAQINKLQEIEVVTPKTAKITVSSVNNTSTSISGTASKLTNLSVYKGSKLLTASSVNSVGKYSLKIDKQAKDTELKIVQKNSKGITVKNKTVTVKAAVVAAPKSMKATATKVTGVATGAKKVVIYSESKKLATVSVNSKGKFSATLKTQKNATKLSIVAYDSVNNKSKKVTVTVKAVVAVPKSMKATATKVTGVATSAKKIVIYSGSKKLVTASANSKGKFSITLKTQKKGTKLSIVAYDSVNNKSKKVAVTVK